MTGYDLEEKRNCFPNDRQPFVSSCSVFVGLISIFKSNEKQIQKFTEHQYLIIVLNKKQGGNQEQLNNF